ncbi:MAG: type II toxin-antitoxin system VapC family toxin [Anaerolineales bacterium]|nr:type II toxin-antitoxin system VapC family toxin [Anaerolineales bacterium]
MIYYAERISGFLPLARPFFRRINTGQITAVTSPITLSECLTPPYREGNQTLASQFLQLITGGPHTHFMQINAEIAAQAARFRVQYNLRLPDALQVATAVYANCDAFLTNDKQLARIQELQVIGLDELHV